MKIEVPKTETENITITNISLPYIQVIENPWIQKTLNIYVVALDDYSTGFIDTAESAVGELSDSLRESTGNYEAWDFRLIRSESVYKNPRIISDYSPNIMIILQNQNCVREYGKQFGNAGLTDPFGIGKILNFRYLINIHTGDDCNFSQSMTVGETVYKYTIHEMIHGLGIKHAWNEKGDLMCSGEPISGKQVWTCLNEDGSHADDNYKDDNDPSEFDLRAIRFIYGDDGFELPNPDIQTGEPYYCDPLPCERFVKQSELDNIQQENVNSQFNNTLSPHVEKTGDTSIKNKVDTDVKKNIGVDNIESISSTFHSYRDNKLGVSLEHPPDWEFASLQNGIQLIKEKNGVYVEVRKHNLDSIGLPLKQYVSDYIKERSSIREDFKLLNITETTISENLPAYEAIYTFLKTENQKDFDDWRSD